MNNIKKNALSFIPNNQKQQKQNKQKKKTPRKLDSVSPRIEALKHSVVSVNLGGRDLYWPFGGRTCYPDSQRYLL